MNKYFRLTFIFIGVWIIAWLINGILSILAFAISSKNVDMEMAFCIPISFVFSMPFVGITWIVAMISAANDQKGERLYRIILLASFFIGCVGAVFFTIAISYWHDASSITIPIVIILSAVSSIIIFRTKIKATQ